MESAASGEGSASAAAVLSEILEKNDNLFLKNRNVVIHLIGRVIHQISYFSQILLDEPERQLIFRSSKGIFTLIPTGSELTQRCDSSNRTPPIQALDCCGN